MKRSSNAMKLAPDARFFVLGGGCSSSLHATRRKPLGASHFGASDVYAWSVKALRVQSRHRRDARVYGHTATVVHGQDEYVLHSHCTVIFTQLHQCTRCPSRFFYLSRERTHSVVNILL